MESEQFYTKHIDKVYKFFYINCFDKKTAEDLTSQTFLGFIENQGHDALSSQKYLYGIMRHVWLGYLRKKYDSHEFSIEISDDFERYTERSIENFESKTPHERLHAYVDRLPKAQKKVIIMKYFEDKSTNDIAAELQKDRNYVKTTVKRGLRSLRSVMTKPMTKLEADYE